MYYIGYDLGSSSIKASLVSADSGKAIAVVKFPDKEMEIQSPHPDWAEQDPDDWWRYICDATKKILRKTGVAPAQIKGIGLAYQMHGLVVIDKNHKNLRPAIIWCDSRAVSTGNQIFKEIGEAKCIAHLLNSPGNFTLSKLKWLKDHEPELYDQITYFLLPGDYIALKLTGEVATTIPGLSEGIMWDFKQHQPAYWLFDAVGISTTLIPDIVPTFSNQGVLSKSASEEIGLPSGIPLLYRAGDQPNNALSLNVLRPGEIAATGGTSGVVYAVTDCTQTKEGMRINHFAHVNYTKENPRIGKLLNINGAGIQYRWIKNNIVMPDTSYEEMNKMAAQVPIGSDGLRIIPFGNGAERMLNNQNKGASIFNLKFNKHQNRHLIRAALEGIAFSFVYGMDILKNDSVNLTSVCAGNDNLFQSKLFSNTVASLIDTEITIINTTGAIGAARAAAVSNGDFNNLEEAFSDNEKVKIFYPSHEKQLYVDAYNLWKNDLEKIYNK